MKEILFVCTGNTCRSPMAEALFNSLSGAYMPGKADEYRASSAGIYAFDGGRVSPHTRDVMDFEYDVDISEFVSRAVTRGMIEEAFLVLTMTAAQRDILRESYPEHKDKIFTLKDYADVTSRDGSINDPYGSDERVYSETAAEIRHYILELFRKLGNGRGH